MKVTLLFSLLIVSAVATMSQSQKSADALCKDNPKWKQSDCRRVKKNEIWIGMTAEMLLASQGAPARSKNVTTAAGTTQLWVYEKETGTAFRQYDENHRYCVAGCKTEVTSVHIGPTLRVDAIEN
jgi:hypothetical protein